MSHFAEHDLVGKLAGNVPQEQVEDNLLSFWRSYSKEFPGHQVFGGSQPLRRTIPCYLHGDEGRRYKKSGVMIVSLQTILGQSKSKKVSKKHLKQSQTLNLRGHSFSTRFLLMAIPRRYYANQSEVYLSVFEAVIRDLLSLQNEGFEYDGSMWRVQVLGLKGDLPYLTKTASLTRHYLRAARKDDATKDPPGMCFLCAAGQKNVPYEDFSDNARWLTVPCSEPWVNRPSFLMLHHLPDAPHDFLKPDIWHCWHGGIGMDFAASALAEFMDTLPETSAPARRAATVRMLAAWIKKGDQRPHGAMFPQGNPSITPDVGWSKFDDTRIYVKFIEDTLVERGEPLPPTLAKVLSAARAINQCMRVLYGGDLWLSPEEAKKAGYSGRVFIWEYASLAQEAYSKRLSRFPLFPKIHYLDHSFRRLLASARRCPEVLNPLSETNQQDEAACWVFQL